MTTPGPAFAAPRHYEVGVFITSVHDLDVQHRTAGVEMWLWSVEADKRRPLATMEFPNGEGVTRSLGSTLPRSQGHWSALKIVGTFRQDWDLRDFPFDRQKIVVNAEEATDDMNSLAYDVDRRDSSYSRAIHLDGWKITGFSVRPVAKRYETTFGDPELRPGSGSTYARMTATLSIERSQATTFFKLTIGLYAAVIISLISYFLSADNPSMMNARMCLLAGSLFAAVLNMRFAFDAGGQVKGVSLLDKIHIVGLVFIVGATLLAIVSRLRIERGEDAAVVRRFNGRAFVVAMPTYAVLNAILIALAIHNG